MRSVMKHMFSEVPSVAIPRSSFDRSHGHKTTFDAGYLVPVFVDEALPGDTFQVNLNAFARLATPLYPIMDNMRMETFFFFVPYRLIWDNFQKFCGEQASPGASTDYLVPKLTLNNAANETIFDYMGLPTYVTSNLSVNALPFRAYNLVFNEWFRDQNLQASIVVNTGDGPDLMGTYALQRRGKRHDYFTSCLPWLQKGEAVQLHLGTMAPVGGIGKKTTLFTGPQNQPVYDSTKLTGTTTYPLTGLFDNSNNDGVMYVRGSNNNPGFPEIYADLSQATASTVNELRQAIQVQRILERDARAGTRYTEIVQSHFGVISPDARLQRPEYLGGGSSPVHISPVAQTFGDANAPTGTLAAIGTAGFTGHGFAKSFTEHGVILGLINVRADLTYQQGVDKMWLRSTRYDFYWPALAHLGEQAVLNKEIFVDAASVGNGVAEQVFGYQERYAEYRYKPSKVTGKFRSNDAGSLDAWHLSQEFAATPALSSAFIQDDPPVDRVIAVPSEPHFLFDSYINMRCTRPMPVYSVPGLIDHF